MLLGTGDESGLNGVLLAWMRTQSERVHQPPRGRVNRAVPPHSQLTGRSPHKPSSHLRRPAAWLAAAAHDRPQNGFSLQSYMDRAHGGKMVQWHMVSAAWGVTGIARMTAGRARARAPSRSPLRARDPSSGDRH